MPLRCILNFSMCVSCASQKKKCSGVHPKKKKCGAVCIPRKKSVERCASRTFFLPTRFSLQVFYLSAFSESLYARTKKNFLCLQGRWCPVIHVCLVSPVSKHRIVLAPLGGATVVLQVRFCQVVSKPPALLAVERCASQKQNCVSL